MKQNVTVSKKKKKKKKKKKLIALLAIPALRSCTTKKREPDMADFLEPELGDDAPRHLVEVGLPGAHRRRAAQRQVRRDLVEPHAERPVQEELSLGVLQVQRELHRLHVVGEHGHRGVRRWRLAPRLAAVA
ncbi:hypothetical protein U9M48_007370 [Paspalum notatum var. saurae]|uniref:Uncharacterized protein n=1 Tax=Paspalum notatum var. saurae TaxID=547442 RepID=A0AAQ3PWJ7_PASNO